MITVPPTPLHASLVAFSAAGLDTCAAGHTLRIDPALSSVRYEIECSLGECALGPRARGNLEGCVELALRPGPLPACSAEERRSHCFCRPGLRGVIASRARGLPPLLEIGLEALALSMRTRTFEIEANGSFEAPVACEILDGTLALRLLGAAPVAVPLAGTEALAGRSRGLVWIDGAGIHLLRAVELCFRLDEPASELGLRLRLRGLLRGDMRRPARAPLPISGSCFQLGYAEPDLGCDFVR